MKNKTKEIDSDAATLSRHERKCIICHHPDREAIEEEYVRWSTVWSISRQYKIDDYRTIHRHARATGLVVLRRENFKSALDNIVEKSQDIDATADSIIRAIRAYSCLNERGEWTDHPSQVLFTVARPLTVFQESTVRELPVSSNGIHPECLREEPAIPALSTGTGDQEEDLIHSTGIRNPSSSLKTKDAGHA